MQQGMVEEEEGSEPEWDEYEVEDLEEAAQRAAQAEAARRENAWTNRTRFAACIVTSFFL
jgi:hypothetical protein